MRKLGYYKVYPDQVTPNGWLWQLPDGTTAWGSGNGTPPTRIVRANTWNYYVAKFPSFQWVRMSNCPKRKAT